MANAAELTTPSESPWTSEGDWDARLPPLGDTFWPFTPKGSSPCLRRSRSFSGYFPRCLKVADDPFQLGVDASPCNAATTKNAVTTKEKKIINPEKFSTWHGTSPGGIAQGAYPQTSSRSERSDSEKDPVVVQSSVGNLGGAGRCFHNSSKAVGQPLLATSIVMSPTGGNPTILTSTSPVSKSPQCPDKKANSVVVRELMVQGNSALAAARAMVSKRC
jgi:hypothetical protein